LINLADQKANILLGLIVFIITFIFLKSSISLNKNDGLALPIYIFLAFQSLACVLALLVILPRKAPKKLNQSLTDEDNPMFFGCYTKYTQDEYLKFVDQHITDNEQARRAVSRDAYQTGQVLQRKYHYLRLSYLTALIGIIVPIGFTFFKLQS